MMANGFIQSSQALEQATGHVATSSLTVIDSRATLPFSSSMWGNSSTLCFSVFSNSSIPQDEFGLMMGYFTFSLKSTSMSFTPDTLKLFVKPLRSSKITVLPVTVTHANDDLLLLTFDNSLNYELLSTMFVIFEVAQ